MKIPIVLINLSDAVQGWLDGEQIEISRIALRLMMAWDSHGEMLNHVVPNQCDLFSVMWYHVPSQNAYYGISHVFEAGKGDEWKPMEEWATEGFIAIFRKGYQVADDIQISIDPPGFRITP